MKPNFEGSDSVYALLKKTRTTAELKSVIAKAYPTLDAAQTDVIHNAIDSYEEMLKSSDDLDGENDDVNQQYDVYVREIQRVIGNEDVVADQILSRVHTLEEERRSRFD